MFLKFHSKLSKKPTSQDDIYKLILWEYFDLLILIFLCIEFLVIGFYLGSQI